jgi:hypothetical protein
MVALKCLALELTLKRQYGGLQICILCLQGGEPSDTLTLPLFEEKLELLVPTVGRIASIDLFIVRSQRPPVIHIFSFPSDVRKCFGLLTVRYMCPLGGNPPFPNGHCHAT